ncbi:DUF2235 domain-containing protein [uncultured Methylobacterium sp.]|uniref:DUF2235 domain-containing protein n=1 Tax=uncultured Methylobacterium sp. TaxID=157278 RepID=UPI0035CC920E
MARKRLVICCDGTWNDADVGTQFTNVVRMARAIEAVDETTEESIKQIVYYHSGVGSGSDSLWQVVGGATGLGLSRNVRDAYAFIANNFCDGDELFFFGFSRGAYTVRSVAGLIGWAGILHKVDMDDFALLWEGFKLRKEPNAKDVRLHFPDRHADVTITCIGVWDTVGALGIPGHLNALLAKFYEFQDTDLSHKVRNAFHALAIDEHRSEFVPTLWKKQLDAPPEQHLEQVWFAGAHSNVGGGYDEHGLSDVALAWMADRVGTMLAIDRRYLTDRQDRRNAWGLGRIYDSATGIFGLLNKINRNICAGSDTCEAIHESVAVRFAAGQACPGGAYGPKSLPGRIAPGMAQQSLGSLETTLRWPAADPRHLGGTGRPAPEASDPLMRKLNI